MVCTSRRRSSIISRRAHIGTVREVWDSARREEGPVGAVAALVGKGSTN